MDKIIIKDLEIYAYHGVFTEEKKQGQTFILSLELDVDLRLAGKSDDLTKTVHYGELCHDIVKQFTLTSYDLIEKAAEELCQYILLSRELIWQVKLTLYKPQAPIGLPLKTVAVEMVRAWHTAYIALGSNLGDKKFYIDSAMVEIAKLGKIERVSDLIVTEPFGCQGQDDYLNGALKLRTLLTADELLDSLMAIELSLGRERKERWGARTIDLDILLYDKLICESERLALPHPRMAEREFVLQPLSQIEPYLVHPLTNERICTMLEKVRQNCK